MANLDGWDWALLVVGAYVAVVSLVRLMRGYRDALLGQLRDQIEQEQLRQSASGPARSAGSATGGDRQKTDVA
jgi:hypothetical protein